MKEVRHQLARIDALAELFSGKEITSDEMLSLPTNEEFYAAFNSAAAELTKQPQDKHSRLAIKDLKQAVRDQILDVASGDNTPMAVWWIRGLVNFNRTGVAGCFLDKRGNDSLVSRGVVFKYLQRPASSTLQ